MVCAVRRDSADRGIYAFCSYLAPGMGPAPLDDPAARMAEAETDDADESGQARTPTAASGPVVFTSEMDGTWVKFYDADGERLYEAQMDEGDSFTVPADAEGPQGTGRPYALAITVGAQYQALGIEDRRADRRRSAAGAR